MKYFWIVLVILALGGGGYVAYRALVPGGGAEGRSVFGFVPDDVVFLVESDAPVSDWESVSSSATWRFLKGHPFFGEITASADALDALLRENRGVVELVKLGKLVISAHVTKPKSYDFLIAVDLQGQGEVGAKLMGVLGPVLSGAGYTVSESKYFNYTLYDLRDVKTGDVFTMSFVGNVLVGSYTKELVRRGIARSEEADVMSMGDLKVVRDAVGGGGQYRVYVRYGDFDRFVRTYVDVVPELLADFPEILGASGFEFEMGDRGVVLDGYTKQVDSVASFLTAFKDVGRGESRAHEVLPHYTAMYTSVGFDKFGDLYGRFMGQYAVSDAGGYADFKRKQGLVEKVLGVELEEDFFSWMRDEVVTAVVPIDESTGAYAYYGMFKFKDYALAKEKMDFFAKRVKRRTPTEFEETEYKGFEIKYLKLKGFFNLFFKKLFSKIEQPHYAFVDDYVVFSNDVESLQYLIDRYLAGEVLGKVAGYGAFAGRFEPSANVLVYLQSEPFFNYLRKDLDASSRQELDASRDFVLAFPQVGMQLYPSGGMYRNSVRLEFKAPAGL